MDSSLSEKLKSLAQKYEVASFCDSDPSQFLRRYSAQEEAEAASFFTAMLSFGSRSIFIPKLRAAFDLADKNGGFYSYIKNRHFTADFPSSGENSKKKFYRFYSYADIALFFEEMAEVFDKCGSLGSAVHSRLQNQFSSQDHSSEGGVSVSQCEEESGAVAFNDAKDPSAAGGESFSENTAFDALHACHAIQELFPKSKIVSKGKTSPHKRIFMFLRWMSRASSPVDLGLWPWLSPSTLVIPLDTHVIAQSQKLGLIPEKSPCSIKTALLLTDKLKEVWPEDPVKGDFALFGLGVNEDEK